MLRDPRLHDARAETGAGISVNASQDRAEGMPSGLAAAVHHG
jgi:hypothetical protein